MKTKIIDSKIPIGDFLKKNTAMIKSEGDKWFSGVYWFKEVVILGKVCYEMHTFETMPDGLFEKIKQAYGRK